MENKKLIKIDNIYVRPIDDLFVNKFKTLVKDINDIEKTETKKDENLTKSVRQCILGKIKNISFNLEMKPVIRDNTETKIPILHTTVYFNDGTYVKVCNSKKDKIEVKEIIPKKDIPGYGNIFKDSTESIYVASESAKEQAIVYALFKKIMNPDCVSGEIEGNGYISDIHKMVEEKSIDQNLKPILKKLDKEKARINHQNLIDNAKARRVEKIHKGNILDVLKNMSVEELITLIKNPENFLSKIRDGLMSNE